MYLLNVPCNVPKQPFVFRTNNELYIDRSANIADEFGLNLWVKGNGYEYRRIDKMPASFMNPKSSYYKFVQPTGFNAMMKKKKNQRKLKSPLTKKSKI